MKVVELTTWTSSNLLGTRLCVPTNLYQREFSKGWDVKQMQEYVIKVFEGRGCTPFVVNVLRSTARVMDGAHRLEAIDRFKRDKFGIPIRGSIYLWSKVKSTPCTPVMVPALPAPTMRTRLRQLGLALTLLGCSSVKMTGTISTSSICWYRSSRTFPTRTRSTST